MLALQHSASTGMRCAGSALIDACMCGLQSMGGRRWRGTTARRLVCARRRGPLPGTGTVASRSQSATGGAAVTAAAQPEPAPTPVSAEAAEAKGAAQTLSFLATSSACCFASLMMSLPTHGWALRHSSMLDPRLMLISRRIDASDNSTKPGFIRCMCFLVGSACSHTASLGMQVALLSVLGQWVPAMLWLVLQKLHEAALWLWQHTPGSRDRVPPQHRTAQQRELSPAHPPQADATMPESSLSNNRSGQRIVRVASQPRRLSELDELIRVCESLGREQQEPVS